MQVCVGSAQVGVLMRAVVHGVLAGVCGVCRHVGGVSVWGFV